MTILSIVHFPASILETPCERVVNFDEELETLLDNMYETMVAEDGVGLAAPQVGVSLQVAIVDIEGEHRVIELINPEIIECKGREIDIEGCLSFPGLYGKVQRYESIQVSAFDRYGNEFTMKAKGFLARAIQHEIDHLKGILFTSKVIEYVDEQKAVEGSDVK